MSENSKVVTSIRASRATLDCPHCGAEQDGWMVDPRGCEQTCDECKLPYEVAADASVHIS